MSDTSQGPGWWQASDDRWYPPDQRPRTVEWNGPICRFCGGGFAPGAQLCGWCHGPTDPEGCCLCGATPSVDVEFRRNTGMVVMFQMETYRGRHCRDCGIARFRETTNYTLLAGWWGVISFFVNWVFLVLNVAARRKVAALPGPLRAPNTPSPLPLGRPITRRVGIWVPVGLVGLLVVGAAFAEDPKTDGFVNVTRTEQLLQRCVEVVDDEVGEVGCDGPNDGWVSAVVDDELDCPATSVWSFSFEGTSGPDVVCVSH